MNRQIAKLDKIALISNSDAHSLMKLGREANIFATKKSYDEIWQAVRDQDKTKFIKTLEFFPEEGKYHLDGHRKCETRLTPEETKKYSGQCPKCGAQAVVGTLHRVTDLADRPYEANPPGFIPHEYIVPLAEILGECFQVGTSTKKVLNEYFKLIENIGSEFFILREAKYEDLEKITSSLVVEGIRRVRNDQVLVQGGYDGQYGTIKIFTAEERERLSGPPRLF